MPTYIDNNQGPNTGWLYYKKYYNLIPRTRPTMQNHNNLICAIPLLVIPSLFEEIDRKFSAITTYPGLVLGTGYTHEQKKGTNEELSKEAFKIGFFFDHTSGMPIIPGSSVKGLLRSVFPQRVVLPKKVTSNQLEKENWIRQILFEKCEITGKVNVDELEREIFDGARKQTDPRNPEMTIINPVPVYERDIFFDAVPIGISGNNQGQQRRLLGSDYITPHKNREGRTELDPFSEPNPIKFLKIMPKVVIEFRFKMEDSKIVPELNAKNKVKLFEEIIKTLGIGAKTNVGYGQFEP